MVKSDIKDNFKTKIQKKSYQSPLLTHFGTVGELTSGGSMGDDELMMMTAPAKRS